MGETGELVTVQTIRNCVYIIRGQQVMLDNDLADIYGCEVKRLNEQVKRNISRFPDDFMFQLTKEEYDFLKPQIVASRQENLKSQFATSSWGGKRKLPYAFTEQGIYMLAAVLKGEPAEQQSIFIMRAFKEMRHYIRQNRQFVTQSEMSLVTAKVSELSLQMSGVLDNQKRTDKSILEIWKNIDTLNESFMSEKDFRNFIIYKGQKFEADAAYIDIYRQAEKSIYVVDDYMNTKTLQLLSQKQEGVEVILFTENAHGKRGFLATAVVNDFIKQYPPLRIKPNPDCHDRWIVLDYGLPTEAVYHCGASSKDAGKKVCAINKVASSKMIHPVIDALLLLPDKSI